MKAEILEIITQHKFDHISSEQAVSELLALFAVSSRTLVPIEIKDEYRAFQEDWKIVEADLKKWMGKNFKPSLIIAIEGKMNLTIPPGGFRLNTTPRLIVTQKNKERFKDSVPMAMFVDYKR